VRRGARRPTKEQVIEKQLRTNERIRIAQVRVIADDGAQLGVMNPMDALRLAREKGLDLVEVAPMTNPPVCRIMDFNKFKYEQSRRDREAKKKHHLARLKEVKFKPHIEDHDYMVKLNMLKRFLGRGDKAKVTLVFRGRELAHVDIGRRVLERLVADLTSVAIVERTPILEGRFMTMIFQPDHAGIKRLAKKSGGSSSDDDEGSPEAQTSESKPGV
jgi:translation initiation factor IF-3